MSGKSKQSTLFKFGFKKTISHRNETVEVIKPDFVNDVKGVYKCDGCEQYFKSKQGLSMHTSWVHKKAPEKAGGNSLHIYSKNLELKDKKEARSIVNGLITAVEKQETKNSESTSYKSGRRGADKRTKYNFVFKMRIIEQLDGGKCAADVAFDNGIDKSLGSKWNKDRKTFAEAKS